MIVLFLEIKQLPVWHRTRAGCQKSGRTYATQLLLLLVLPVQAVVDMKEKLLKYKKPIIITTAVIVLQMIFGFDAKFCIINIIWLLV